MSLTISAQFKSLNFLNESGVGCLDIVKHQKTLLNKILQVTSNTINGAVQSKSFEMQWPHTYKGSRFYPEWMRGTPICNIPLVNLCNHTTLILGAETHASVSCRHFVIACWHSLGFFFFIVIISTMHFLFKFRQLKRE